MKKLNLLFALLVLLFAVPSFAATAAPVNVSTIAVAGSTITVTTSAPHNLAAIQAGCLNAPATICFTIATVPSGTTFTFTAKPGVTVSACAASCGAVVPMPAIIVLQSIPDGQNFMNLTGFNWLPTLNGLPSSGSAWTATATPCAGSGCTSGATGPQSNAIAAGYVIEKPFTLAHLSNALTQPQLQVLLQAQWTSEQAALQNNTQPAANLGAIYDRSGWGTQ